MRKELIPHEEALTLKEIGFDDECYFYYEKSLTAQKHEEDGYSGPFGWEKGELHFNSGWFVNNCEPQDQSNENWVMFGAPLYQQAFRWFREKYKLPFNVSCEYHREMTIEFYLCWLNNTNLLFNGKQFDTHEDAELAGLRKLIEIVKEKNG